jgi:hypothetical protein
MNGNNHREEAIFEQALSFQSPAEREAFLREACGADDGRRQPLLGLVQAHERAGRFLEGGQVQRDALASAVKAVADAEHLSAEPFVPLTEQAGDRIGRYKLLEQIGEGGFGLVWMAEQEEPVRRRVALKIIKLGMLLYELLTGRTPFDSKELLQAGVDEMRRITREKDPPRPSTRLTELVAADARRPRFQIRSPRSSRAWTCAMKPSRPSRCRMCALRGNGVCRSRRRSRRSMGR